MEEKEMVLIYESIKSRTDISMSTDRALRLYEEYSISVTKIDDGEYIHKYYAPKAVVEEVESIKKDIETFIKSQKNSSLTRLIMSHIDFQLFL